MIIVLQKSILLNSKEMIEFIDNKYDLREWFENHKKMGKGITLNEEELRSLYAALEKEIE